MKLRQAIEIVMDAAKRDLGGAGCGIRSVPEGKQREEICRAIDRCGLFVYPTWWRDRYPDGIEGERGDE